jgi:hypothetical protein
MNRSSFRTVLKVLSLVALAGCADDKNRNVSALHQPLQAQCIDDATSIPDGSWLCPAGLTVECDSPEGADVATILSEPPQDRLCSGVDLTVSPEGPFPVGTHTVQIGVRNDAGNGTEFLCESQLTVVDTTPPDVEPRIVELWPPNHQWQTISAQDCFNIADRCDANVDATLLWATSDESANDTGDGNTQPDIRFMGCDQVQLRAERQGSGDGRIYQLGWELADDSGNTVTKTCQVIVPHDQGHNDTALAGAAKVRLENKPECRSFPPDAGAD